MGKTNQSGIFYMQQENKLSTAFPKEYRRGLFSRFERKFFLIFAALIFIAYSTIVLLIYFSKRNHRANRERDS